MGAYIADDMGVSELNAKGLGRIDTGVHAGQDEVLLGRRQGQRALSEGGRVLGRSGLDVALDGRHGVDVKWVEWDLWSLELRSLRL